MWNVSFPFHFGIYLTIGCTVLMFGTALLGVVAPSIVVGGFGTLLKYGIMACGYLGLGLGILGALGLLGRRLSDPDLKDFTAPADIFNLLFFVVAFGCALAHALLVDRDFGRTTGFFQGLITFKMTALPGEGNEVVFTLVTITLMGMLLAYIPMTHMSHFVGKYFAYHTIRWNDEPNTPGSEHEKPINDVLQYPVSWAAPHIEGDGKKSWADVATVNPAAEEQSK
jgi:nitrate reductase gamma subunit